MSDKNDIDHEYFAFYLLDLLSLNFVINCRHNINGRDVQRKNVVNNVDKSSLWAPRQNGPYKNTQNITNTEYTKTQHT